MKASILKKEYTDWREANFYGQTGFFPVFKDMSLYLPYLSPGATTLYLYIGLHSNNITGECFHSLEKMSTYYNKSIRTISNWVKELEEIGLIERLQLDMNAVAHTYLKPFPNPKLDEFILLKTGKIVSKENDLDY
ncbi:helix-turn-helix domain-containing protein [Paraburkholderia sp. BR10872]|uniref:helix-turn-helix domain-containing protein n=1 Tax=Paraburkholderia sp. BR10872 TaxID=3236989 RepID=UPI0034D383F6